MVTLAEELVLLAYNDDTGRNQANHLALGLAGAFLLDLTLAQRIDLADKNVVVVNPQPVGHPLLDETLHRISTDRPRKPKAWVPKLHRNLPSRVLAEMVRQQILSHDADTVLGFIPFNRYRAVNPAIEADVRARLESAVVHGTTDDPRTAALAGLVYALSLEKHAVPTRPRREVRRAMKAIAEGSWAADATRKAIEATQAAVMASITAAIVASSTTSAAGS